MARPRREWVGGDLYHLYSRGSNRQAIVLNEADLADLESILFEALEAHHVEALAWCLMPNHWHCLVRSPDRGRSRFMQAVNQRHSLRFNRRWGRTAHVFENRFGAVLQESEEQLLWTIRYIVRNPVEAGIAATPVDVRWSSYRASIGLCTGPATFGRDALLALFTRPGCDGRASFEAFVGLSANAGHENASRPPDRNLVEA